MVHCLAKADQTGQTRDGFAMTGRYASGQCFSHVLPWSEAGGSYWRPHLAGMQQKNGWNNAVEHLHL